MGSKAMLAAMNLLTIMHIQIGRPVVYVLAKGRNTGQSRAAFITRVLNDTRVNLHVLTDGPADDDSEVVAGWIGDIRLDETGIAQASGQNLEAFAELERTGGAVPTMVPGTWHFAPPCDEEREDADFSERLEPELRVGALVGYTRPSDGQTLLAIVAGIVDAKAKVVDLKFDQNDAELVVGVEYDDLRLMSLRISDGWPNPGHQLGKWHWPKASVFTRAPAVPTDPPNPG